MTPYNNLKIRLEGIDDSIKNLLENLSHKKRISDVDKANILELKSRRTRIVREIEEFGKEDLVILVRISSRILMGKSHNQEIYQNIMGHILYINVTPEEVQELVKAQYPNAKLISATGYKTGIPLVIKT